MWPFSRKTAAAAVETSLDEEPQAAVFDATPPSTASSQEELPADVKMPRPHRCNARVEDFVQSLVTWEYAAKIQPAWGLMRQCFKSDPGQEPSEPYLVIKDPAAYLDPRRIYAPRPGMRPTP